MKAEVTKAFAFSPDGIRVEQHAIGSIVEGRAAEKAVKNGWGKAIAGSAGPPPPPTMEAPEAAPAFEEKAIEAAPQNKALTESPKRKKRSKKNADG